MKLKQNISNQPYETEKLPPTLEKLRKDAPRFRVPDGYFDSLSPRIVDSIKKQENRSLIKVLVPTFRKPLIWAPALATVVVAVFLFFVIPAKNTSTNQVADEWTQINMAYDESYAQEALLSNNITIDNELENPVSSNIGTEALTKNQPTVNEIKEYLKEHENEIDILNEY